MTERRMSSKIVQKRMATIEFRRKSNLMPAYLRIMREVALVSHPLMRISVHHYNGHYRLRFELDRFEQSFKFSEMDHSLQEVEQLGKALAFGIRNL